MRRTHLSPTSPPVPAGKPGEIRSLTGLRGIAAIYVMLYHATGYFHFPEPFRAYIRHGYLSVDLFFVLSGFVMAMTYGRLFEARLDLKAFKTFILMRVARVWPLYIVMTVITAVLIATVLGKGYYREDLGRALLSNFTLTQAWGFSNSIVRPSWSISTEWAAYLLFPFMVFATLTRSARASLLWGVAALGMLALIAYGPLWFGQGPKRSGPLDIASSYASGTMIRTLASFVIGMIAYRFRAFVPARTAWLFIAAIGGLLIWRFSDVGVVAMFALLIMALSHDVGIVARGLGSRVIYLSGVWSYAIYLIHDLILYVVFRTLPKYQMALPGERWQWLVMAIAGTVALSAMAHYLIERPSRGWLRGLILRPTKADQADSRTALPRSAAAPPD